MVIGSTQQISAATVLFFLNVNNRQEGRKDTILINFKSYIALIDVDRSNWFSIKALNALCPNLMNLSRGLNPTKTGFHFAPKIEIEKLDTIFSGTKYIWAAA